MQRNLVGDFSGLIDLWQHNRCPKTFSKRMVTSKGISEFQPFSRTSLKWKSRGCPTENDFTNVTPLRFLRLFNNDDPRFIAGRILKFDHRLVDASGMRVFDSGSRAPGRRFVTFDSAHTVPVGIARRA